MKKLALGRQEFSKLIEDNCIYVDKTEYIYQLIQQEYYFLSRPRRFGKSLLLNTIKELFLGHKQLFKDLWIYDKIEWKEHPVIKISFSSIDYYSLGLEDAIRTTLDEIATSYQIKLESQSPAKKFDELIRVLSKKEKVVILIDEYDKPIIDYLSDEKQVLKNRDILKNFYSVIKDSDQYIRFFFVTGVSKFSQVSIFSDLNNLVDITLDEEYSQMIGWTPEEVLHYFPNFIKRVAEKYKHIYNDIMPVIKEWYNGYSWDGIHRVYNPVSLMYLFSQKTFRNYWFTTATPTFLIKLLKEKRYTAFDIENSYVTTSALDKFDITDISLLALLFQTGYLTIKEYDLRTQRIVLDYPNKEVAEAFSTHLLAELTIGENDKTDNLIFKMIDAFDDNRIEKFIEYINELLKTIPYTILDNKEKYFHSIFYTVMALIGYRIDAEVLTIDGRIDAVVRTDNDIFILEFKINQPAEKAIQQIKDKGYADKYASDKRPVHLLGINFDTAHKRVDDWVLEA